MSTISIALQAYETRARQRNELMRFTATHANVKELTEKTIELFPDEDITLAAERFMLIVFHNPVPVEITTYRLVDGDPVANTSYTTTMSGIYQYPGKVSIYIENPSDNVSDLPYQLSALFS